MIDIHNHILPGIDDGATDIEDSLNLLRLAIDDGITKLVCTPHMHAGRFDNDANSIQPVFERLTDAVAKADLPIKLAMAAEVRISDEFMIQLKRQQVPFIGQWQGRQAVLLEMPHQNIPMGLDNLLNWLDRQEVQVIIAHPERNKEIMRYPERALKIAEKGVLFQVTAGSVAGRFGENAQTTARWLLDRECVDFMASDAHHVVRRPPAMKAASKVLDEWFGVPLRERLTLTSPDILTGTLFNGHASGASQ
ncbi:hypothetical protein ACH42_07310 [Endozoicomonas sp. (ex Bugula neritina AB1)]|nr:hypothetical protein ACH42_07310 [Endozoicomonas sp. (ex Bugula neritina AB1)]